MVRPCEEKNKRRCINENMEDGSEWTSKNKETKTEVERNYTKKKYTTEERGESMRRPQLGNRPKKKLQY